MGRRKHLKDVNQNQIPSPLTHSSLSKGDTDSHTNCALVTGILTIVVLLVSLVVVCDIRRISSSFLYVTNKTSAAKDSELSESPALGGWKTADLTILKEFGSSFCNIDTIYADQLNTQEFRNVYYRKKPVVVKFRKGAGDWTDPSKWTIGSLKEEYGEWTVGSGNAREIVRRGGNGNIKTSVEEYIDKVLNTKDSSGERSYVFDRAFYRDSSLSATLKPPDYFTIDDKEQDGLFFLGASESGVSFHKHADAWNGVVYGRKRWFLYELEQTPPGGVYPGYTPKEWYRSIYSNLTADKKPKECIQEAGDIMYIPESMYHATINLGDTVAVGIQNKKATSKEEKLFYRVDELEKLVHETSEPAEKQAYLKERLEKCKKLLNMLPENSEVHMKLGSVYSDMGQLPSALYHTERSLQIDEYFLVAMMNLANIYEKISKNEEVEKTYEKIISLNPHFWDVFAYYGSFLIRIKKPQKAVKILKQGVALQPNSLPFWYHLKHAQETIEDHEGALQSVEEIKHLESQNDLSH